MKHGLRALADTREALRLQSALQRDRVRGQALALQRQLAETQRMLSPAVAAVSALALALLVRRRGWRWLPAAYSLYSAISRAARWLQGPPSTRAGRFRRERVNG